MTRSEIIQTLRSARAHVHAAYAIFVLNVEQPNAERTSEHITDAILELRRVNEALALQGKIRPTGYRTPIGEGQDTGGRGTR